jgi:PHD/YefM family antitoxin component YafN of YafNO toxin-antitoxin module
MRERVTTLEVRAKLGEMLNRVDLQQDEFIIERQGHALAALVPLSKLELMELLARRYAREVLEGQQSGAAASGEVDGVSRPDDGGARDRRTRKRSG